MAEEDEEEAVVEEQREDPEPFGGVVHQARAAVDGVVGLDFSVQVAEERAEEEDLEDGEEE